MVVNHALLSKEEEMEKYEVSSNRSDNPARIEDIFEWIDGIPLSKTTKNLPRDFSDGVLMSEILKFYYPHLVSPHNYVPANGVQAKKDNWLTLNRKVLSKINMHLSAETIDQLVHSQHGTIEKVLSDFREKQMSCKFKNLDVVRSDLIRSDLNLDQITAIGMCQESLIAQPSIQSTIIQQPSMPKRFFGAVRNFFAAIFGLVLAILCFWKWFSKKPVNESLKIESKSFSDMEEQQRLEEEDRLRDSYSQALDELRVKDDVIKTLCHKVAFFEGSIKLKDMKIATLTSQLGMMPHSSNDPNAIVSARQPPNNPLKLRKRPRTQI